MVSKKEQPDRQKKSPSRIGDAGKVSKKRMDRVQCKPGCSKDAPPTIATGTGFVRRLSDNASKKDEPTGSLKDSLNESKGFPKVEPNLEDRKFTVVGKDAIVNEMKGEQQSAAFEDSHKTLVLDPYAPEETVDTASLFLEMAKGKVQKDDLLSKTVKELEFLRNQEKELASSLLQTRNKIAITEVKLAAINVQKKKEQWNNIVVQVLRNAGYQLQDIPVLADIMRALGPEYTPQALKEKLDILNLWKSKGTRP